MTDCAAAAGKNSSRGKSDKTSMQTFKSRRFITDSPPKCRIESSDRAAWYGRHGTLEELRNKAPKANADAQREKSGAFFIELQAPHPPSKSYSSHKHMKG